MDGDEERTTNHTILTYPTLGTPCTGHPGQLVPGEKWVRVWRTLWCCCQSQWVRKHRPCPGRCLGSARLCSWSWLFLSRHRHYSCLKEANAKCWIKQGSKKRKISLVMDFLKIIWQWQYSCATETKKGQKYILHKYLSTCWGVQESWIWLSFSPLTMPPKYMVSL